MADSGDLPESAFVCGGLAMRRDGMMSGIEDRADGKLVTPTPALSELPEIARRRLMPKSTRPHVQTKDHIDGFRLEAV